MKALLIVDIQKDFCPGGALAVKDGDSVIEPVNSMIQAFTEKGQAVFFTRDWHPADHCSFADFGGIWPVHCVAGTAGAEFHSGLNVPPDANIISKATESDSDAYSGFEGTDLERRLGKLGVNEVIIAGLATDYCIKNTVLDAVRIGYNTWVAEDGIMAVNVSPEDGEAAVKEMSDAGAVFGSSRILIQRL